MIQLRWPTSALFNSAARADDLALYIGGYTKNKGDGLCSLRFNPTNGTLHGLRMAAPIGNPDWLTLAPNNRTLYAGGARDEQNGLSAFAIENDGSLRLISQQIADNNPVSLAVDATEKWLVGAHYHSGSWSVWPLPSDGTIGERTTFIKHEGNGPNLKRQQSPHAHQVMIAPDNERIWIVDLGIDRAMIYDFDAQTGAVRPSVPTWVSVHAGAGPRHLAWGKDGNFVYILNELDNTISVFQGARGFAGNVQTVSTLPAAFEGNSTGAEIIVSPDGRFLYASNRGYDSLARFAVERDGTLNLLGFTEVSKEPRHFTFDPTGQWVLVGNQQSRSIEVFSFDNVSGNLSLNSKFEGVKNEPTCLVFGG